jgi:DNA-binding response OmpR family regulator
VTAHSTEEDRKMARESGFHDFIAKPYHAHTLLSRLSAIKPRSS